VNEKNDKKEGKQVHHQWVTEKQKEYFASKLLKRDQEWNDRARVE